MRYQRLLLATVLASSFACAANAEIANGRVRVGVLTDLSGGYEQNSGNGSVEAARMAAEDMGGKINGLLEILPLLSTSWFGRATKLPGRTLASPGINRPPAAASNIVTLTTSPTPNWKALGGRRSVKVFEIRGVYRASFSETSRVSLT